MRRSAINVQKAVKLLTNNSAPDFLQQAYDEAVKESENSSDLSVILTTPKSASSSLSSSGRNCLMPQIHFDSSERFGELNT